MAESPSSADALRLFSPRTSIEQVEEGNELAPKFDEKGFIPCVTTDYGSGELLMVAVMNQEALEKTITTGEARFAGFMTVHHFSDGQLITWCGALCSIVARPCLIIRAQARADVG